MYFPWALLSQCMNFQNALDRKKTTWINESWNLLQCRTLISCLRNTHNNEESLYIYRWLIFIFGINYLLIKEVSHCLFMLYIASSAWLFYSTARTVSNDGLQTYYKVCTTGLFLLIIALRWCNFRLQQIFNTASAASKNTVNSKII